MPHSPDAAFLCLKPRLPWAQFGGWELSSCASHLHVVGSVSPTHQSLPMVAGPQGSFHVQAVLPSQRTLTLSWTFPLCNAFQRANAFRSHTTMPPRVRLCANCASLPFRPRLANKISQSPAQASALQSWRAFADAAKDKGLQVSQDGKGPNTDQLPHVSEEAAVTGKITGGGGPDLSQGTPVEEVRDLCHLQRYEDAI